MSATTTGLRRAVVVTWKTGGKEQHGHVSTWAGSASLPRRDPGRSVWHSRKATGPESNRKCSASGASARLSGSRPAAVEERAACSAAFVPARLRDRAIVQIWRAGLSVACQPALVLFFPASRFPVCLLAFAIHKVGRPEWSFWKLLAIAFYAIHPPWPSRYVVSVIDTPSLPRFLSSALPTSFPPPIYPSSCHIHPLVGSVA